MRKIVLAMMTTLNGRVDDPGAWVTSVGDDIVSDDIYAELNRAYRTFDTVLVGWVTYKEMFEYWPGAEHQEGGSENNKSMARMMNSYKKFVFTSGSEEKTVDWSNAELVVSRSDDDMVRFVRSIKAQNGRDIHLAGGAGLAQSFVRLDLVDEYHFYVYPVVSAGATWFGKVEDKREMELISATPYRGGVVGSYFKPKGR